MQRPLRETLLKRGGVQGIYPVTNFMEMEDVIFLKLR